MKTSTVSEFRQNMKEHLEEIQNDQDFLILSGPKKMDFVVLTLEMFNAMEETAHLLSTPANTTRLMESIADDKAGRVIVKNLDLLEKSPRSRARHKTASRRIKK